MKDERHKSSGFKRPHVMESQKQLESRLAHRRDEPHFAADLMRLRQSLATGVPLNQARERCGFTDDQYFEDLVVVLGRQMVDPSSVLLEWSIKQQTRYMQAMEIYQLAKGKNRLSQMAKAVMMMHRMDLDDIELKRLLGLIKPVKDPKSLGTGISDEDVRLAELRWRDSIEHRVRDKLEAERRAAPPQPIDVFPGPDTQRDTDPVGQITLDVHASKRPEQRDRVSEVVSDGSIDILHNLGTLALQDETGS